MVLLCGFSLLYCFTVRNWNSEFNLLTDEDEDEEVADVFRSDAPEDERSDEKSEEAREGTRVPGRVGGAGPPLVTR